MKEDMRLTAETALTQFWSKHPESQRVLQAWYKVFKSCAATDLNELKKTFATADYVPRSTRYLMSAAMNIE
ncbi:type II toxin-antitoxin system HigB family toxin [Massilia cavernae]|uniref:Uncharacterized protein n=1 Tax=Massilia cavernae TaxID=2320864 RepID=A0A418XFJ0_9BURK|nr:type II toxin-antitoxin system HigB family toxin [Massilia cavernae]RJG11228.1 hypothetical protein D3872_20375 [Massilia cavernae]